MKQYIPLGEVITKASVERCGGNQFPILSITMKDGLVLQDEKFKKRIASVDTSDYKVILRGKLVQGIHIDEANFGIQDIVDAGIVSPAYKVWDVNDRRIFPKYLEIIMRSPRSIGFYKSKLNGSVNRRGRMTDDDFLGMLIPVVDYSEQIRIVDILKRVKGVIAKREHELSVLDDLIKARFVEMFEYGKYPQVEFGEICEYLRNGANIKQTKGAGGYPITRIETLANDVFNTDRLGYADIFELGKYDNYLLKPGDILISHINSTAYLGRAVQYRGQISSPIIHGMNLLCARIAKGYNPTYIEFFFKTPSAKEYISSITKKAVNQASITTSDLKKMMIPAPSLEKQNEFDQFVAQIDKSKSVIQKSLDETQLLFDSLMQEYFG